MRLPAGRSDVDARALILRQYAGQKASLNALIRPGARFLADLGDLIEAGPALEYPQRLGKLRAAGPNSSGDVMATYCNGKAAWMPDIVSAASWPMIFSAFLRFTATLIRFFNGAAAESVFADWSCRNLKDAP
ncbi:MAG: hypothetical protein IPL05_06645 [Betaproteobacteria bacterium]|nr:hypothetical protein [Betaproteobacteria bacterium]